MLDPVLEAEHRAVGRAAGDEINALDPRASARPSAIASGRMATAGASPSMIAPRSTPCGSGPGRWSAAACHACDWYIPVAIPRQDAAPIRPRQGGGAPVYREHGTAHRSRKPLGRKPSERKPIYLAIQQAIQEMIGTDVAPGDGCRCARASPSLHSANACARHGGGAAGAMRLLAQRHPVAGRDVGADHLLDRLLDRQIDRLAFRRFATQRLATPGARSHAPYIRRAAAWRGRIGAASCLV